MRRWVSAFFFLLSFCAAAAPAAANEGMEWRSGERLYMTGKDVALSEDVDGALTALGDRIVLGNDTEVTGDVFLAGRVAVIDGRIGGNLEARAPRVLINGPVAGNVSVWADKLEIAADADIAGDLSFFVTSEPDIDPEAFIGGDISAQILDSPISFERRAPEGESGVNYIFRLNFSSAVFLGFLAAILALVAPGWTSAVQDVGRATPAQAVAYGVGWLLGLPLLAIFAALTVVGIPLAFILLLLYVAGLALGMVMSIHLVGAGVVGAFNIDLGRHRRILAVVLGALILWGVAGLPLIGGVLWFAAVSAGVGAVLMAGRSRYLL
jgi:cytoskeletal protein CcmA (bactofilin family)